VLRRIVTDDAKDETSKHDVGGNLIPMLVERGEAQVYDFAHNEVPGATERDRGYWRDVGTLDAFWDAHMDLISVDPVFNLYNLEWPILTRQEPLPPAKFFFADEERMGHTLDSMVCAGGRRLRRGDAALRPVAERARPLARGDRRLGADARGRSRPRRSREAGDRGQERVRAREGPAGRRPRGRGGAVHGVARRRRRRRQGRRRGGLMAVFAVADYGQAGRLEGRR
jgi:hypothetical protein